MHRGERTDISKAHEFFERAVKWQERATSEKQEEQKEEQ